MPTRFDSGFNGVFHGTISGPGIISGNPVIPEPATILLLATGLAGVVMRMRRKNKCRELAE